MTQPLGELRSREVFNLPDGVTKRIRFGGVRALDSQTGEVVFLMGPVDLARYHTTMFSFTDPVTGQQKERDGIPLLVIMEDGVQVEKYWNLISRRAQQQLTGDLETGNYLNTDYEVTGVGAPPTTQYTFHRVQP